MPSEDIIDVDAISEMGITRFIWPVFLVAPAREALSLAPIRRKYRLAIYFQGPIIISGVFYHYDNASGRL